MIWAGNCNRYFFKILKYVLSVLDNSNMEFWVTSGLLVVLAALLGTL